ncbi:MAG: hypothetical protein ACTSU5_06860 [Promethearchaeota archaeon]
MLASALVDVLTSIGWILVRVALVSVVVYLLLPLGWKIVAPRFNASYVVDKNLDAIAQPNPEQEMYDHPEVVVDDTGGYSVNFGVGRFFREGSLEVHHAGEWYSSHPRGQKRKLLTLERVVGFNKSDELGSWAGSELTWKLADSPYRVVTTIATNQQRSIVKFTIHFPDGLRETDTGDFNVPVFRFPNFTSLVGPNQRVIAFQFAFFCPPTRNVTKKATQGPVCFYDNDLNAAILGPTDHFMIAFTKKEPRGAIHHGFEGRIKDIPVGFEHSTLLYFTRGINSAFVEFCNMLRSYYGVPPRDPYSDPIVANLGFWTQNGAHYYYRKEKGMNYEDTILYCWEKFREMDLPINFFQLDSWWYQKAIKPFWKYPPGKWLGRLIGGGAFGGTTVWEAIPEEFPNGLKYIHEKTGWPFACHARWFDPKKSPYIGKYKSIAWKHASLPMESKFWDDLLEQSAGWGLKCYEQDWLKNTFTRLPQLQEDVHAAEHWLTWMSDAALKQGISIQYCMAPAGAFMYALKLPAVTNARTTGDYHARVTKQFFYPQFSQTNILAWAIGIWPSLDCYLTRTTPLRKGLFREKFPEQVTLLSNLGGGVICPSDKAERVDRDLLMKTCTEEGLLLKPDRPITANDLMFRPHRKPYIMDTWTVKGGNMWHYIVAVNLWPGRVEEYSVSLRELGISHAGVLYDFFGGEMKKIGLDDPIPLDLKKMQMKYLVLAPFVSEGLAVIGSPDKYVTCANKLVPKVEVVRDQGGTPSLEVELKYSPRASIKLLVYSEGEPRSVDSSGVDTTADWQYDKSKRELIVQVVFGDDPHLSITIGF